jgi:hypothetical protein
MKIPMTEFDIVFMSYDEPNADYNYADLLTKAPWAKRSHGVKGSDACHKAAAKLAETDRFITVDADNIVREDFFNAVVDLDLVDANDVISWAGKNVVNGLVYGNGGVKCWPKHVVEQMKSHEAAVTASSQVDFCWDINYVQMNNVYSDVMNNASPLQAWRAGFREGVKMSLVGGVTVDPRRLKELIHYKNLQRLLVWCSVGEDVQNGLWAMYGARLGCYLTNLKRDEFNYVDVRDFEWLVNYFATKVEPFITSEEQLRQETRKLGVILQNELNLDIADLDVNGSKFFKSTYVNPNRLGPMIRETQVLTGVGDNNE